MSDRTSAEIFSIIFEQLAGVAEGKPFNPKALARELYDERGNYDFSDYQMEADDALVTLGLARRGLRPEYPEEGEIVIYRGDEYFDAT